MLDAQTIQLMHVHGGEHVPMVERSHPDSATQDPERQWREGVRIFGCTTCDEEIVVLPPGRDRPDTERA